MNQLIFTVYFEDPFWVGLFESRKNNVLTVCRHVFGAQPTDPEIYQFVLTGFKGLVFSRPVKAVRKPVVASNPKRRQREAARLMKKAGSGTKAQEILKEQMAASKQVRQEKRKHAAREKAEQAYLKRREKQKARHKGH